MSGFCMSGRKQMQNDLTQTPAAPRDLTPHRRIATMNAFDASLPLDSSHPLT